MQTQTATTTAEVKTGYGLQTDVELTLERAEHALELARAQVHALG